MLLARWWRAARAAVISRLLDCTLTHRSAAPPARTTGLRSAARSAWAGLAAGCLHTLAGADHLAALTPLTIGRSHFRASLMGALWGFGHSTGQLMLGLLMVVLKDRFQQVGPPSLWVEIFFSPHACIHASLWPS